jgi:PAS domain-containing protein
MIKKERAVNARMMRDSMPRAKFLGRMMVVGLLTGLALPASLAGSSPKADIDDLDGDLYRTREGWELKVAFEIEIETDHPRRDDFALLLNVSNDGRPIRDETGKPLEIVVPMEKPSKIDDDEIEFEGKISIIFEPEDVDDPRKVRINARLIRLADNLTLDVERIKAKYHGSDDDDHGRVVVCAPYCSIVVRW